MSVWIDVKEALPPEGKTVLCAMERDGVWYPRWGQYVDSHWRIIIQPGSMVNFPLDRLSHWTPLCPPTDGIQKESEECEVPKSLYVAIDLDPMCCGCPHIDPTVAWLCANNLTTGGVLACSHRDLCKRAAAFGAQEVMAGDT